MLSEVARRIARVVEPERLMQDAAEAIQARMNHTYVAVVVLDEEGVLVGRWAGRSGVGRRSSGRTQGPAGGIIGRALRKRAPQVVADVSQDPDYHADVPGTRSEMVIPLLEDGEVVGRHGLPEREARRLRPRRGRGGGDDRGFLVVSLGTRACWPRRGASRHETACSGRRKHGDRSRRWPSLLVAPPSARQRRGGPGPGERQRARPPRAGDRARPRRPAGRARKQRARREPRRRAEEGRPVDVHRNYPLRQQVVGRPCSIKVRKLVADDPNVVEALVMDDRGALVCATVESSDYWQGDEPKWQRTYQDGQEVFVDAPALDTSTGVYAVQLSV